MSKRPWIIFDGDDTLWHTTALYGEAKSRLRSMLDARGLRASEVDGALSWLEKRDVELAGDMGYSMHRFPRSLRDTAVRFLGEGEHAWAALGYGYNVFASAAEPMKDAGEVLERLAVDWNLALLTAGERTIQEKRVADFQHADLFSEVRIVPSKSKDVLEGFAREISADPASGWVVGDSLRSDVLPAVGAGFSAVHLATQNWSAYECDGHQRPAGVTVARTLAAAADLIAPQE